MSTYCMPSTIVAVPLAAAPEDFVASQNAPPMRRTLATIEMRIGFVILLDAEQRIDYTCRSERVGEIEQCERDYDYTRGLEEYPLPRLVRNVERTEGKECEHREGAERENEHRHRPLHEAPRGERIELHGLGESAREEKCPDADEHGSQVVVVFAAAHHMPREPRRHRKLQPLGEMKYVEEIHSENQHDERHDDAEHHVGGESERSEEHTSELQSQSNLVCRLLLEKN